MKVVAPLPEQGSALVDGSAILLQLQGSSLWEEQVILHSKVRAVHSAAFSRSADPWWPRPEICERPWSAAHATSSNNKLNARNKT